MSIWILILAVAPLYVWAALHVRKSKTTWSRFDVIEIALLDFKHKLWELEDSKMNAPVSKKTKRTRKKRS